MPARDDGAGESYNGRWLGGMPVAAGDEGVEEAADYFKTDDQSN